MCLIVHRTLDDTLTPDLILDAAFNNPHGWGLFYHDNSGAVHVEYGPDVDSLLLHVHILQETHNREFIIHFRLSTHGDNESYNQHPFQILPDLWVMHNGIIEAPEIEDKTKSDTWRFVELILKPIFAGHSDPEALVRSAGFKLLMEEFGGYSNRLCFFDRRGPVFTGDWSVTEDGVMVSNQYSYTVGNPSIKKYAAGYVSTSSSNNAPIVPAKTSPRDFDPSQWEKDDFASGHRHVSRGSLAYEDEYDARGLHEEEVMEQLCDLLRQTPEAVDELIWTNPEKASELILHLL